MEETKDSVFLCNQLGRSDEHYFCYLNLLEKLELNLLFALPHLL